MPTCDYLLVCEFTFSDQQRRPCLIGIYDAIVTEQLPIDLPRLGIAVAIRSTVWAQHHSVVSIVAPDGTAAEVFNGRIVCGPVGVGSVDVNCGQMRVSHAGTYAIVLLVDGQELKRLALTVTQVTSPGSTAN